MSLNKLSIKDVDVSGKTLFIRVDFNVPMDKEGKITNTARIEAAIPTLKYALDKGAAKLVLCSHLGRPSGKGYEAEFTLKPVAEALAQLIGQPVHFCKDCVGDEVEKEVKAATEKLVLLENVRFHSEEECKKEDDPAVKAFRAGLRKLADIYVDDAFGTAHRAHSSMVGEGYDIRCAGLLLEKEINYFRIALEDPQRPYCAILGGAKVSDKIQLIRNFLPKVNKLIICGGMAYTFIKQIRGENYSIGKSLYDEAGAKIVHEILEEAKKYKVEVVLPVDFVCADDFKDDAKTQIVTVEQGIPDGWMGLDCGPKSAELFAATVKSSKTVMWNGPAGVFEMPNFAKCTFAIAQAMADLTAQGGVTIVGGGDSATAIKKAKLTDKVSHVSTGGGAAIELLEGKVLPGVARLSDKK